MEYSAQKALEALVLLVEKTNANLYDVMKMVYVADKRHLAAYGRTITGDRYSAMGKGPVPSETYELCKHLRGESYFHDLPQANQVLRLDNKTHRFEILAEPERGHLSQTDIRYLTAVASDYLTLGWRAIFDESHDSAWKVVWKDAQNRGVRSRPISISLIASTLPNAQSLLSHLEDPMPGEACLSESA